MYWQLIFCTSVVFMYIESKSDAAKCTHSNRAVVEKVANKRATKNKSQSMIMFQITACEHPTRSCPSILAAWHIKQNCLTHPQPPYQKPRF